MPWTIEYAPEPGTVVITASGEVRNEDASAQAVEAMALLKQNRTSAVLVDYSEAQSEVTLPSLYALPDVYAHAGVTWHGRMALVLPRNRYRIESYHFFELVCKNAGYNVVLFEAREEAESWLAQPFAGLGGLASIAQSVTTSIPATSSASLQS